MRGWGGGGGNREKAHGFWCMHREKGPGVEIRVGMWGGGGRVEKVIKGRKEEL